MTDANHEKKIKKVEAEMVELKKQIMQIEFVSKRDHAAARKEIDQIDKRIGKRLEHLSLLMGITYDELNLLEEKIQDSGRVLANIPLFPETSPQSRTQSQIVSPQHHLLY